MAKKKICIALFVLLFLPAVFPACSKKNSLSQDIVVRVETAGISAHPASNVVFLLIDKDPNIIFARVKAEFPGDDSQAEFRSFSQAIEECAVSSGTTDKTGSLTFRNIPRGSYWVIDLKPVVLGDEQVSWAHPVSAGEKVVPEVVQLQRSNAAARIAAE
jgi:hypothetical protein